MKQFLFLVGFLIVSFSFANANCQFNPERMIGKADVLNVTKFSVPKKNKCFPSRGELLGRIHFEYEYPEGSYIYYEFVVYYDESTQCFHNGNPMKCSDVVEGSEIGDVRFFEKKGIPNSKPKSRGVLNHLFMVVN